jgi:hypothetical protein
MYRMRASMERIQRPDELQRWKANYDMWDLLLGQP